jgi:hypothetical protein
MLVVLDTNVVSEAMRARPDAHVLEYVEQISAQTRLTAVTKAELLFGVHRLPDGARRRELHTAVTAAIEAYEDDMLAFDSAAAAEYAQLTADRAAAGRPMPIADAQIAAICLAHDATLATRNVQDFADSGLQIVNPWLG